MLSNAPFALLRRQTRRVPVAIVDQNEVIPETFVFGELDRVAHSSERRGACFADRLSGAAAGRGKRVGRRQTENQDSGAREKRPHGRLRCVVV